MLQITTEYPIMKGDTEIQIASLQGTLCNLIDELKYLLPQCGNQLDALADSVQNLTAASSEQQN